MKGPLCSLKRRHTESKSRRLHLAIGAWCALAFVSTAFAEVKVTDFGNTSDGTPVKAYTITSSHGVKVKLISRGATLVEWHVPDKNGKMDDVVFGFDDVAGYESKANGYFGCVAGRVANRVANGKFQFDFTAEGGFAYIAQYKGALQPGNCTDFAWIPDPGTSAASLGTDRRQCVQSPELRQPGGECIVAGAGGCDQRRSG